VRSGTAVLSGAACACKNAVCSGADAHAPKRIETCTGAAGPTSTPMLATRAAV
jgi:hypothetical protein